MRILWILSACNYIQKISVQMLFCEFCKILKNSYLSLFEKWSTIDPKKFYVIPFQKLVFLISLYPEFLEKRQRNKKSWFLVNSRCFCFVFYANLVLDGKKKRLEFLFMTPLIFLINMSISFFRWTYRWQGLGNFLLQRQQLRIFLLQRQQSYVV